MMKSYLDLSDSQMDVLAQLYAECDTTCDDLPYTDDFQELYARFLVRTRVLLDQHGFWRALVKARKSGRLARKERVAAAV